MEAKKKKLPLIKSHMMGKLLSWDSSVHTGSPHSTIGTKETLTYNLVAFFFFSLFLSESEGLNILGCPDMRAMLNPKWF